MATRKRGIKAQARFILRIVTHRARRSSLPTLAIITPTWTFPATGCAAPLPWLQHPRSRAGTNPLLHSKARSRPFVHRSLLSATPRPEERSQHRAPADRSVRDTEPE